MNGIDLGTLNSDIRKAMDAVERKGVLVHKKVAFQFFGDLVKTTPRRTGRAQNGFMMTIGSPSSAVPSEGRASYPPAQPASLANLKLGDTVWEVNNVKYIVRLNQGWSKQAPGGMTAIALANLRAQFA